MKTYIVKCEIEKEFEAEDEFEATELFYEELANDNDWLENHIKVEEINN